MLFFTLCMFFNAFLYQRSRRPLPDIKLRTFSNAFLDQMWVCRWHQIMHVFQCCSLPHARCSMLFFANGNAFLYKRFAFWFVLSYPSRKTTGEPPTPSRTSNYACFCLCFSRQTFFLLICPPLPLLQDHRRAADLCPNIKLCMFSMILLRMHVWQSSSRPRTVAIMHVFQWFYKRFSNYARFFNDFAEDACMEIILSTKDRCPNIK